MVSTITNGIPIKSNGNAEKMAKVFMRKNKPNYSESFIASIDKVLCNK